MSTPAGFLAHPLLARCDLDHGFGTRGATPPAALVRPRQVHGVKVMRVAPDAPVHEIEADVIVSTAPGVSVAVVTADCVPILLAASGRAGVAAIHAGWRGLSEGVVSVGVAALRECVGEGESLVAAIGPCVGACCYEVDDAVVSRIRRRFADELPAALHPPRVPKPGHVRLDLAHLVRAELLAAGVSAEATGSLVGACTQCDAKRFHSYRRDGPRAGRLVHFVCAPAPAQRAPAAGKSGRDRPAGEVAGRT